jgi:phosphonate degradation associated HDIG domain protein
MTVDDITELLQRRGAAQYGREAVSQLQHALQCAHLAETAGEPDELVAAALLHDLGHLLAAEKERSVEPTPDRDDLHQFIALPLLRGLFSEAVLAPIGLHVDAKRWLCAQEPGYFESLSPASVRSLALQGGPFTPEQAQAFDQQPHAEAAVRLRRYDDWAKVPGTATPTLDHYAALLRRLALR